MFYRIPTILGFIGLISLCSCSMSNKSIVLNQPKIISSKPEIPKTESTSIEEKASKLKIIHKESGVASWYGGKFNNKKTASGERFNQNKITAAHKTLPLGSKVIVTNTKTGKQLVVRITDRGPYKKHRIIDLSKEAANQLGILKSGVGNVKIELPKELPDEVAEYIDKKGEH